MKTQHQIAQRLAEIPADQEVTPALRSTIRILTEAMTSCEKVTRQRRAAIQKRVDRAVGQSAQDLSKVMLKTYDWVLED